MRLDRPILFGPAAVVTLAGACSRSGLFVGPEAEDSGSLILPDETSLPSSETSPEVSDSSGVTGRGDAPVESELVPSSCLPWKRRRGAHLGTIRDKRGQWGL